MFTAHIFAHSKGKNTLMSALACPALCVCSRALVFELCKQSEEIWITPGCHCNNDFGSLYFLTTIPCHRPIYPGVFVCFKLIPPGSYFVPQEKRQGWTKVPYRKAEFSRLLLGCCASNVTMDVSTVSLSYKWETSRSSKYL